MKVKELVIIFEGKETSELFEIFRGYYLSCSRDCLLGLLSATPIEYASIDRLIYSFFCALYDPTLFKRFIQSIITRREEHIAWLTGKSEDDNEQKIPIPQNLEETKELLMKFGDRKSVV